MKCHFLNIAWRSHSGTHGNCGFLNKACRGPGHVPAGMVERLARSRPKLRIYWQLMASRGARASFLKCGRPWYISHPLENLKTQVTFTQRLSVKVLQPKAIMGMPTDKQVILIFRCSQGRRMLTPRTLKVPQQRGSQRSYGNVVLAWVI